MGIPPAGRPKSGQQRRRGHRSAHADLICLLVCSLGGASNHDFDGNALSLGPKRRPTLVLEDEGPARVDGVSAEDSFVGLARDRAGLATLSVDEANNRSAWSRRSGRPCGAGWSLLALFALGAGQLPLLFPTPPPPH